MSFDTKENAPQTGEAQVQTTNMTDTMNPNTTDQWQCVPKGMIDPIVTAIPKALRAFDTRWTLWEAVWNERRAKFDKVPKRATKIEAGVSTRHAWWSFDSAVAGYDILSLVASGGGLGFLMTNVRNLVGIDMDRCVEADGRIADWAQEIVTRSGSYAELSPSGTGLRVFVAGSLPQDWTDNARGLEVYAGHEPRFLTITGCKLAGCANDVQPAPEGFLEWLQGEYPPATKGQNDDTPMPDLVDESELPSIHSLTLPEHVRTFLRDGEHKGDGSRAVAAATCALYEATAGADGTLNDSLVLSILRSNPHAWDLALSHRRHKEDRALEYLWRHHCLPQRGKVVPAINDFSTLDQARREHQKRENERIGDGDQSYPTAEVLNLETALTRFVFLSDGSRVADIFNPHYDLAFADWAATHAASFESLPQPGKSMRDGTTKPVPDKVVPVTELWKTSPKRKTAVCRTFKAGGSPVLKDPEGREALNTWRPFDRSTIVQDPSNAGLTLFLEHVDFLFGKDAGRFLDWLAHIEQRPGELPHTAWLHIAKNFGLGRNWLESVLTRVWAGSVASNLDLPRLLKDGFNGRLSRKVLAVVDEIREGGRDSQWEHSERLKSIITEETRLINPKYGRQTLEFNACRWLMFSNHLSAIPLESGDRRIEVVYTEAAPQGADYYARLYSALNDPQFIASVAKHLGQRDLSRFNPGAHASNSDAKKAATKASQTPMASWCEMLLEHWPSDLITSRDLYEVLEGRATGDESGSLTAAHRRVLESFGVEALGKPLKIAGRTVRASVLRDKVKWKVADPAALREELVKAQPALQGAREYLMDLATDEVDADRH